MINNMYLFTLLLISLMMFNLSMITIIMKKTFIIEWSIMSYMNLNFNFILLMDWMSLLFLSVVMFISSMVMIYSKEYMMMEKKKKYFIMILMLFVMSMMLMILSPNMMSIILGWDGLGLISYCLIIYYQSSTSFNSGMITLMTNRIGDIMLLIMIYLSMNLKSWNITLFKFQSMIYLMFLLIMIMTKSAQIPFSMWLPAAMAAPTPVSSLVHSSTLVTAGIYLLIRFNSMFIPTPNMMLIIGLMTMFKASINALYEFDLKKIIAFSTLSQLGLMMHMMAYPLPNYVFFHLISHAMFKSLLFLCSGIMIHFMMNNQDIRLMGNIINESPMVVMFFNFSTLSLCGFPFLSGYYSKDMIYEMSLNYSINPLIMLMSYISISLTLLYSLRLMFYLTFTMSSYSPMSFKKNYILMNFSILMLFLMTITFSNLMNWMMFSSINLSILNFKLKMFIYMNMMMSSIMFMLNFYLFKNKMYSYSTLKKMSYFFHLTKLTMFFNYPSLIYSMNMNNYNEYFWNEFYMKFMINMILNKFNYMTMNFFNSYLISIFTIFILMIILLMSS